VLSGILSPTFWPISDAAVMLFSLECCYNFEHSGREGLFMSMTFVSEPHKQEAIEAAPAGRNPGRISPFTTTSQLKGTCNSFPEFIFYQM
jgi:hypothetical protein